MKRLNIVRNRRGMSLIEVVIDMAILSLISTVVISSLLSSLGTVRQSATIAIAGQVANQKIEELRNLKYDDLATINGPIYPPGNIPDDQTTTQDNKQLTIHISIEYVDDPYDGLAGGSPNDLNPADYKKITVQVYDSGTNKQLAQVSTDIASRAAETASNTGVLKISILDAGGVPVSEAMVTITNPTTTIPVNIITTSDQNGLVFIPNLPPSNKYHIVATKLGYSNDYTSPISVQNPHPVNPDATVLLQQATGVTLTIDRTAVFILNMMGLGGNNISGTLTGQKVIGANPTVIKNNLMENIMALTTISNLEFDSYTLSLANGWYITTCTPMQPFVIAPSSSGGALCSATHSSSDLRINTIIPGRVANNSGANNFEIDGANFNAGATVTIQAGAGAPIPLAGLSTNAGGTVISGSVDFTGVPADTYSITVTNPLGAFVTQPAGLIVSPG